MAHFLRFANHYFYLLSILGTFIGFIAFIISIRNARHRALATSSLVILMLGAAGVSFRVTKNSVQESAERAVHELQDSLAECRPSIVETPVDTISAYDQSSYITPERLEFKAYQARTAILDGTIFVGRHFNDIVVGGKNVRDLELAARAGDGSNATLLYDSTRGHLAVDYWLHPYIELSYNSKFFSIQTSVSNFDPVASVSSLRRPTMHLQPAERYLQ